MQTNVTKTDIKIAISTDHSPVCMDITVDDGVIQRGPGFWKYNSSLNKDPVYKERLCNIIRTFLNEAQDMDKQLKWELLKYEVKKFTMQYTRNSSRQKQERKQQLEDKLQTLLENDEQESDEYKVAHKNLDEIYDDIATGVRIRSKCDWYEQREKSTKYFLNLEKMRAKTSTLTRIKKADTDITTKKDILAEIEHFYKSLFKDKLNTSNETCKNFLNNLTTPTLNHDEKDALSVEITVAELFAALSDMPDNKSPLKVAS